MSMYRRIEFIEHSPISICDSPFLGSKRGSTLKTLYRKDIDPITKNCKYSVRDEINIQEDINSYRDGCCLEQQLLRLSLAPVDAVVSSLKQNDTFGADISSLPRDLTEYLMMYDELRSTIPNLDSMISSGYTIDKILETLKPKDNSNNENNDSSEDSNNGTNE